MAVSISIHALCEEGDPVASITFPKTLNFYPRPLRGGRPANASLCYDLANFYPRPLRGGRPFIRRNDRIAFAISIHALCEEGDRVWHIS